jgi:hypothetical protein
MNKVHKKNPTNLCLYIKWISNIINKSNLNDESTKMIKNEFEKLKDLSQKSNNLVQYLDMVQSKMDVFFLVSVQYQTTLADEITYCIDSKKIILEQRILKIICQVINGLNNIHENNISFGYINPFNICLDNMGSIQLSEWVFFHLSWKLHGKKIFKGIEPYLSPELVANEKAKDNINLLKLADIWSFGVILLEFKNAKKGMKTNIYRSIKEFLDFIKEKQKNQFYKTNNESYQEAWIRLESHPKKVIQIMVECLEFDLRKRPTIHRIIEIFFQDLEEEKKKTITKFEKEPLLICIYGNKKKPEDGIIMNYYDWRDYNIKNNKDFGEELYYNCEKLRINTIINIASNIYYHSETLEYYKDDKNYLKINTDSENDKIILAGNILDDIIYKLNIKKNYSKSFKGSTYTDFTYSSFLSYTGVSKKKDFSLKLNYGVSLASLLSSKDKDKDYQLKRVKLFRNLLIDYPFTRAEIIKEAKIDIPVTLRGEIWACMLNIPSDIETQEIYDKYDLNTEHEHDSQIDVDVPRCHQYIKKLNSTEGQNKLSRVLKKWIRNTEGLVYWQGLDSITAPILILNYHFEAKVFLCMRNFVNLYLKDFFVVDNSLTMERTLLIFEKLLMYHDPQLATHLIETGFYPELYAIPWFLTLFAHIFSIEKIFKIWDIFLMDSVNTSLYFSIALIRKIRNELLNSDFNLMMSIFNNSVGDVEIMELIKEYYQIKSKSPISIKDPEFIISYEKQGKNIMNVREYKEKLISPRIGINDFKQNMKNISIVLDLREEDVSNGQIQNSIHLFMKESEFFYKDSNLFDTNIEDYLKFKKGLPIVIIPDESQQICKKLEIFLCKNNFYQYVSVLFGNID